MEAFLQSAARVSPSWRGAAPAAPRSGFRLIRYFTATSFAAFLIVAVVLSWLERQESVYFGEVQKEQQAFVDELQREFGRQETAQARLDLVLMHEAEHVNLTRLLANALWDSHFAPFVNKAERVPIEHCRKLTAFGTDPANAAAARACFAEAGRIIRALPELRALDAKLADTMKKTTVFKVKVFDVRGLTLYSSEPAQIGEDKQTNEGWWIAADGQAASELTHKDKFSAFEGVVEDRDLISSYVPVFAADGATVLAVFEIYSDVTPFLERIRFAAEQIARTSAMNRKSLAELTSRSQAKVDASSYVVIGSVAALLVALYLALLMLVRRAQRLIDAQAREREQSIRREERWHREKMSVLGTMAATMGHEIGNPLATITAVSENIAEQKKRLGCSECRPELILEQTRRIAARTRQMEDFAAARGERVEAVDVNDTVKAVCEFLSFDRRFRATAIDFRPAPRLPARTIVVDHLTEALMNLLQGYGEDDAQAPERIVVTTGTRGDEVVIGIHCEPPAETAGYTDADARMEATRRRVNEMGGILTVGRTATEIALPAAQPLPV